MQVSGLHNLALLSSPAGLPSASSSLHKIARAAAVCSCAGAEHVALSSQNQHDVDLHS